MQITVSTALRLSYHNLYVVSTATTQDSNQQDPTSFTSSGLLLPTRTALPKACSLPTGRDLGLLHDPFSSALAEALAQRKCSINVE